MYVVRFVKINVNQLRPKLKEELKESEEDLPKLRVNRSPYYHIQLHLRSLSIVLWVVAGTTQSSFIPFHAFIGYSIKSTEKVRDGSKGSC